MPFQSEKQRRYLHANHPEIAKRWERDYANGGILDINESEEIIDDDGNEIELTDYNAAFDDPNDLSTGVRTLFEAKDGGNIRLQPHTASDLLAKKNPDGTRSKYQPPGRDYGGPPSRSSQPDTRGRDDPAPFQPPQRAPVYTAPTITRDDKPPAPPGEEGGPGYISPADLQTLKTNELKDIITRGEEEKKDYVKVPAHKSKFGKKWDRPEQYVTTGEAKTIAKLDAYVDKNFGMFSEFNIVKQVVNLLQDQVPLIGKFLPEFFPTTDIHGNVISSTDQVTGADLGFFQDEKWDYLWKKGPKDDDERDGDKGPIYDPLTGAVDEEFAQGEYMQGAIDPRDWMAEIRARQAIYQGLKSGWENQQLNSGGLANLFRVKNR